MNEEVETTVDTGLQTAAEENGKTTPEERLGEMFPEMKEAVGMYFDTGTFCVALRVKRARRTMREVEDDTGVSPSTISRLEAGGMPDMATFLKLLSWLEVGPEMFIRER